MIRNFLTLAFRNLMKRKLYSFINIFGLAVGVAVCLVILKYVDFELSYDSFHSNRKDIYRVITTSYRNGELRGTGVISTFALGPSLLADEPEVRTYLRTHPMYGGAVVSYQRGTEEPIAFREKEMQYVDSTFFRVFTYSAIQGDLNSALQKPNSVVITRKIADKYFQKNEVPLGKLLKVSGGWADGDYEVTAVLKDVPENSHFPFDFLFPIHNLLRNGQYTNDDGWGWSNFVTYVQLHPGVDAAKLEAKLPAFVEKYRGKDLAESNSKEILTLQPLLKIHLQPGLRYDSPDTASVNTIYFFALISVFVLAIAWINYINLSTARAMERAREVGVKKVVGAMRGQLIAQFAVESILVNFIGVVIAVLIAMALLPVLGDIVGKSFSFDFSDARFWMILTLLFVAGSVFSGTYPALVLSSFRATEVLKGQSERAGGGFSLRKALVVFQFTASLVLIAGTFAVYRQLAFMDSQDKGLVMDQMLVVNGPSVFDRNNSIKTPLITLKEELKKIPGVTAVATSGAIPGGGHNWGTGMRRDGTERQESKSGRIVWIDPDFLDVYQIRVLAGRNFNPGIKSDMESVLINEAALTAFGLGTPEHALTERLIIGGDTTAILGVLKNYHWTSLKTEHEPWLFKADTISGSNFSIHLNTRNMNETIRQIGKQYQAIFPGNPFDYYFLDDFFNSQYKGDKQFGNIFSLFALLAILIACLGLWGLASFTTTLKLKEIGIRKVLGASVPGILSLLSWQFLKLLLLATLLGLPLTWFGVRQWLSGFAFRIGLEWDLFVVPVAVLLTLALGTVSLQILRGANTNPAKILRTE